MEKFANLSYLSSKDWWRSSIDRIKPNCKGFILAAALMALSNSCNIVANSAMNGGMDLGLIGQSPVDLSKIMTASILLLVGSIIGLVTGLIALSLWLVDLTASALQYLNPEKSFHECRQEIKSNTKHLTATWFIGALYLLTIIIPMSVLISISIIANMKISLYGEPLLALPESWSLPMNLLSGFFMLLTIDYSLMLTVFSASIVIRPRIAASQTAVIMTSRVGDMFLLNIAVLLLNIGISAPFSIVSLIPQFSFLDKNIAYGIGCQLWLGLTSLITWPLSVLLFAEYLKPKIKEMENAAPGTAK